MQSKLPDDLLAKKMTRKDFIKLVGLALIGLLGVNNFISSLRQHAGAVNNNNRSDSSRGFGSSKFGV